MIREPKKYKNILDNEKENFVRHGSFNPFKKIPGNELSIRSDRLNYIFSIFAGTTHSDELDDGTEMWIKKNSQGEKEYVTPKWWKVPPSFKHGFAGLLLGRPAHLLYSLSSGAGAHTANLGFRLSEKLFNSSPEKRSHRLLSYPFRFLGIVGLGLPMMLVGGALFLTSKLVLHPINWLVQRAIVPAVSIVPALIVFPFYEVGRFIFRGKKQRSIVKKNDTTSYTATDLAKFIQAPSVEPVVTPVVKYAEKKDVEQQGKSQFEPSTSLSFKASL